VSQGGGGENRSTAPAAVSCEGLVKSFGDQLVLDHIDLEVPAGTIVGIIGPSGCGKTTLIRILTGIVAADEGMVSVLGASPGQFRADHRARFGYMPQLPVLFQNLSLRDNLQFMASMYGVGLRRKARIRELLELVDLWSDRRKRLSNTSGGMQRRLALAATLVHRPELLVLDEPTAGIDPILRDRFWTHFRELCERGRTLIITTQYVGEAALCDLLAVMSDGRLVAVVPPEELRRMAFGGDLVRAQMKQGWVSGEVLARIRAQPYVISAHVRDDTVELVVDEAPEAVPRLTKLFADEHIELAAIEPVVPPYDEVFLAVIEADRRRRAQAPSDTAA
jgi:ABC-2 type transport system ATP-binding protein